MSKFKFSVLVVFVIAIIVSALVFANNWRNNVYFDKITVSGNLTLSKKDILNVAHLKGDSVINIEELNIDIIQDRIAKHPEVKKVYVSKEPPAELKIDITERRPVAIINFGNEIKLVDKELEIFSFKNFEKIFDLPVINGLDIANVTKTGISARENDIRLALFMILESHKIGKYLYNQVSEINLSDSNKIIVYSNDNSVPFYFPRYADQNIYDIEYQKEISNKLVLLKGFLEQVHVRNVKRDLEYVDLRFSNQVVVKKSIRKINQ